MHQRSSRRAVLLTAALVAIGVATQPWTSPGHASAATAPTYSFATLTPDPQHHSDTVRLRSFAPNLYLIGQTSDAKETNYRAAVWSSDSVTSLDQESCATWVGDSWKNGQEGIALRITQDGSATRAITITKNIIYGVHSVFNAHVWDSSKVGHRFTSFGQFDLSKVILDETGRVRFMPWRVCLQAVGDRLTFKIWFPDLMDEPTWDDPAYTRTATIPADYVVPGKAGWYVGHLPNLEDIEYTNLTTRKL